ncbi:phytoene desaturase family protein [Amycolatopsis sp. lyj-90]|uniref:phytoene desaturase family protein n=1 Tax=Amycolatopsis sp. lyj-90 TaxID=2789285 RepID=UPI00397D2444
MKRWDAVVVGSGMGGLTSAAYLAAGGKRTLVLEAGDVLGGCTHVFRRKQFEFEVGVHYLGDCGPEGTIPAILRGVGLDERVRFLPMDPDGFDTIVFPDVTVKVPRGWDRYLANLIEALPGDADGLRKFVGVLRRLGESTDRLTTPGSHLEMGKFALRAGTAAVWAMQPLDRLLDACKLSVAARAVLSSQASYLSPPHRAATMVHAVFLHNYIRDGGYFPEGGGQVLAAHLADVVTAHGGEVRTRARVRRILVEHSRVTGVELTSGELIPADVVVSNADIKRTLLELVGPDKLPSRLVRRTDGYRMSIPLFNVYVALDVDLRGRMPNTNYFSCPVTEPSKELFELAGRAGELSEPQIADLLARTPGFVSVQSIKDPDNERIAPPGYTNLEIMSAAPADYGFWGVDEGPYSGGKYRRRPGYTERKEQFTEAMLDRAAAVIPEFREHIVHVEAGSPITQERYTLSSDGVAYGIDLSWQQFGPLRPGVRTPVKGLFLAGASNSWGPGVEGAMASGVGAAGAVLGRDLAKQLRAGAVLADKASLPALPGDWDPLIAAGGPEHQRKSTIPTGTRR